MPIKYKRPNLIGVVDALAYRLMLTEMASFFKESSMVLVSKHLMNACQEIDRIWEENDFSSESRFIEQSKHGIIRKEVPACVEELC